MLKNLKIRSRLLVSYAIVLVLTVIISVTAISKHTVCYKDSLVCSHSQGFTKHLICLGKSHSHYCNFCAIFIL